VLDEKVLYEYSYVKDEEFIEYIKNTPTLHSYFSIGLDSKVKAKNYCGIISYNNHNYYILPKIAKANEKNRVIFTYMLLYAYNVNLKQEELSSVKNLQSDTILEVFIQLFAKNLLKEFQKGIYKTYITKEENLKVLKGKYLIDENIKYNTDHTNIYCSYDEFSQDNALNRFFLYAIKMFLHYVKDKKLLKGCELALDDVVYRHYDAKYYWVELDAYKSVEIMKNYLEKVIILTIFVDYLYPTEYLFPLIVCSFLFKSI